MLRNAIRGLTLALILSVAAHFQASAQLNTGGEPLSFSFEKSMQLEQVPFEHMEYVDVQALRDEDKELDAQPGTPFRFGENLSVNLNPENSGVWEDIKGGSRLWRLGVKSPGAVSINLKFDDYHLPEGAKLYVYSQDRQDVIGAFTHRNNQEDGIFATTLVRGDAVIIEYYEPEGVEFPGTLNLSQVTHGYRGVGEYNTKGFGDSGSCNLNVACDESEGWEDEIRSNVMLVTGSNGFCSGAMINNADNDGTPYLLSANHCHRNPSSVVVWFNWESETCTNPSSPPPHDALSGAVTRSRHSASDFWLLELNDTPPDEYNVFYSGWNRSTDEEIEGYIAGIHHPSADIKKFSYTFDGVQQASYLGDPGSGSTHWRITWDDGTTTEPGSSGSPIYDSDHRIIGQLHGGYAACGNVLPDWYGILGVSWEGGGAASSRLKDWLDPGDTGIMVMDGFDPQVGVLDHDAQLSSIIEPQGAIDFGVEINPRVLIRNAGIENLTSATVSYSVEDGPSESIEWEGELETADTDTVVFAPISLPEGNYEITATIDAPNDENPDNNTRSRSFRIIDCETPPRLPFSEDFETSTSSPDCWSVVDHMGNGQVWQFGTHGNGLPSEYGRYAYIDSDAYGSGNSQDTDLVTPRLDLSNYDDITLSFVHYFRQHQQTSTASVAYSTDDGETWTEIESWTSDTPNPAFFEEEFPDLAGEPDVRFKWKYVGNWSWYWSVGDIEVNGTQVEPFPATAEFLLNTADPELAEVDIYANDELVHQGLESLSYQTGVTVPAGEGVTFTLKASGSDVVIAENSFDLDEEGFYSFIIHGVHDAGEYMENPDGLNIAATFKKLDYPETDPGENEMVLWLHHAVTDAPTVDIGILDGPMLFENVAYGDFTYLESMLVPDSYYLEIFAAGTDERLYVFEADLSAHDGRIVGLITHGFVNPGQNHQGDAFGMYMLDVEGIHELRDATNIDDNPDQLPTDYSLAQNYPNPFNPVTTIQYALPEQTHVRLDVYNITGQRVATLVNGVETAGYHTATFDAGRLASGVYIYRIQAGSFTKTRKMMLVK